MIKKNKKIVFVKKENRFKPLIDYMRTILFSILVAAFITTCLVIKARNEMFEDILAQNHKQKLMDEKVAMEIITETDLLENLKNKTYQVCMHAGEICEIARDYKDAQIAYELAIEKSKLKTFKPYFRLIAVLAAQEKFDDANAVLDNVADVADKKLIKFKVHSYLTIGDKYYSIGKFLSAAKTYERAHFYYNRFSKKEEKIEESIKNRIIDSYIQVADIMVKSNMNSDAIRFLKKAEKYNSENFLIKYKLAIVLADSDPEKSVKYFEELLQERPQDIDYGVFNAALMKAANIADLDNRPTKAKYYRYKIHSNDLFVNRKVIYKNDVYIDLDSITAQKVFFTYPIELKFHLQNLSGTDITNLKAEFTLCNNDKDLETITLTVADPKRIFYANIDQPLDINMKFKRKIYTKKELENYAIKIYLYKDPKYKTFIQKTKIKVKSFKNPFYYEF